MKKPEKEQQPFFSSMAVEQQQQQTTQETTLFDALYCSEEKLCDDVEEVSSEITSENSSLDDDCTDDTSSLNPLLLLEQDFFWDDEELQSLFNKEKETHHLKSDDNASATFRPRKEAVEWILKINAHYGFSALTAVLAVNYLDRFICCRSLATTDGNDGNNSQPWMMQLAAVTCLSLAAKVEETCVPLLLDLQVEGAKFVFEAKTIQRMELLVLSSLKWRMNPVTPLSFLDHIIRRLGLKSYVHWEFLRSCEHLLLSVISDPRFMGYMPSVLATATMLHVIHQVEPRSGIDYENQLLGVLKINKEEVDECYELISDVLLLSNTGFQGGKSNILKRKFDQVQMDEFWSCDYSSYDSWGVRSCVSSSSSSPDESVLKKKRRVEEQQMRLPSLSRVFVDAAVASPH